MALQRVTSYFDSVRSCPGTPFDEAYFEQLVKDVPISSYDSLSTDTFQSILCGIGDGSLKALTIEQVEDIKEQLAGNSVDRQIDLVVWKKCFCFWSREDRLPKSMFIVVDVQNDFISGSLALKNCPLGEDGAEVVPLINNIRHHFPRVVFTKDWHPADHCSFATNVNKYCLHCSSDQLSKRPSDVVIYDYMGKPLEQILWPDHCIQGTPGAELHRDLQVNDDDVLLKKGFTCAVDSYSAFWDNGRTLKTELFCRLLDENITTVFCCGLAYDYCVRFTAQDASLHGFDTYVITDLCRRISQEGSDETRELFQKLDVKEIVSTQVPDVLKATDCTT